MGLHLQIHFIMTYDVMWCHGVISWRHGVIAWCHDVREISLTMGAGGLLNWANFPAPFNWSHNEDGAQMNDPPNSARLKIVDPPPLSCKKCIYAVEIPLIINWSCNSGCFSVIKYYVHSMQCSCENFEPMILRVKQHGMASQCSGIFISNTFVHKKTVLVGMYMTLPYNIGRYGHVTYL